MGKVFENLTFDELCDLMCGGPEEPENDDLENEVCIDKGGNVEGDIGKI